MYCSKCGKEVKQTENFCSSCGAKLVKPEMDQGETVHASGYQAIRQTTTVIDNPNDIPTTGLMILSFIIPLAGIILYCLWSTEFPKKAKCCLKGFIGSIVFYSIIFCCLLSAASSKARETYYYDDTFFSHIVEVIE